MYQNAYQQNQDENANEDHSYGTAMYQTRLPQALERVLLNKELRSTQEKDLYDNDTKISSPKSNSDDMIPPDERNKTKTKKLKLRKRRKKKSKHINPPPILNDTDNSKKEPMEEDVLVEYLEEEMNFDVNDPNYLDYRRIFEAFKAAEERSKSNRVITRNDSNAVKDESMNVVPIKARGAYARIEVEKEAAENMDKPKISKKQWKKLNRYTVSELKQLVDRPDLVEMQDVTASDPKLLIFLKAYQNTVKVPRHWCFKRKYLQGKRGFEKTPFVLPDYIRATGIMELRGSIQDKDAHKCLKSKMREKIRPKLGKLDIDYAKLHDAFFKWQTKPSRMTGHGDIYYESKEFETKLMEKKPGNLSEELRMALGMPLGPDSHKFPPPWLIAMQRYGPPPSYPNMRIPGLNAPIPEACSFGYHAGGWGKPPVDAMGKPLYGDVFAVYQIHVPEVETEMVDRTHWGQIERESDSEEVSSEDEMENEQGLGKEGYPEAGIETPMEGFITPSGTSTYPVGFETPEIIELRKNKVEDYIESSTTQPLYRVLPEKKTSIGSAIMGSTHVYDVTSTIGASKPSQDNSENADFDASLLKAEENVKGDLNFPSMSSTDHVNEMNKVQDSSSKAKASNSSRRHKDFKF